ncbi:MAG: hypothetical protein A2102_00375 [Tenericutes bacterium GWF2_38_8]|nr:MAG: hypothetical protein A2102_00375 [Tenericutes bacterium GWF2_38_8]
MYPLGIAVSVFILCIGVWLTRLQGKPRKITLYTLAIGLFLYKAIEYTIYGLNMQLNKIPLEFSTMSYFIFSISVIFNIKKLSSVAAFCAFVSGIGYLLSFMVIGNQYFENNGFQLAVMAFLNHSILFLGSMLLVKQIDFNSKEISNILKFTFVYVFYVIIMNQLIPFTQQYIFIRVLLGADLLSSLFPNHVFTSYEYLLYFLLIFTIYRVFISLFFLIGKTIGRNHGGMKNEHTI